MQVNYLFRYPNKRLQYVYYPTKHTRSYYSIPFPSTHDNGNVLAFYQAPELIPQDISHNIEKIPLTDVTYLSTVLKMSSVIVLNHYCNVQSNQETMEVYYINHKNHKMPF